MIIIIIMFCYLRDKLMIIASYYKGGVLLMTSLKMTIRFIHF